MYSDDFGELRSGEIRRELRSAIGARRDLGDDLEDQVLEAFLARVERRIDARVAGQLGLSGVAPKKRARSGDRMFWVIVVSMAMSVPLALICVAGTPDGVGIIPVMVALVLINFLYALDRWIGRRE